AGLMILPAIFSFNPEINPDELSESSVGMIFTYLPNIFLALQDSIGYLGASFVASLFFLLVFFAAITSLVSIFEVPVAALMDEKGVSRKWALASLGSIMIVLAILSALSFGKVEFLTQFMHYAGVDKSLFDVIIDVFYETILPLNGLLICIFVIYRWKSANFNASLEEGSDGYKGSWFEKYVDVSLKTFIPLILLVIFVNTVAVKYFGFSVFG
ncbi:MAG: sodium-dependent transporter, partial [Pseudomonadota bacterium]|nr:sodium-dependent transporter [Pseudomonadota bacterium]